MKSVFTRRQLLGAAAGTLAWSASGSLHAQAFPSRPIRVIVPYAAGASGDLIARMVGPRLADVLGQPVVVENRPGAGGTTGAGMVAKAAPDGYTLLMGTDAQMAISPNIQKSLPYDAERSFAPVVQVAFVEFMLTVHPSVPANSVAELVDWAKRNPGKYSYASHGIGSTSHLSMEWLKRVAGMELLHVPYKGSSALLPDVIAGNVQVAYTGIAQTVPLVTSGKLKALAVGSGARLSILPDVPTIAETYRGFEANASWNYFAPAGTPPEVVARLNREINRILGQQDIQRQLVEQGLFPIGGPPEKLRDRMRADREKWGKVSRQIDLRPE